MNRAIIGLGSCGIAAGGREVRAALKEGAAELGLALRIDQTGCLGLCHREVLVELEGAGTPRTLYGDVEPAQVRGLLRAHFAAHFARDRGAGDAEHLPPALGAEVLRLLARQERIVLRNCGRIDPTSLDDYRREGGYKALEQVLRVSDPEQTLRQIEHAGLRGRGGAGFPTAQKWARAREAEGRRKFVICNADEGDPGAFMDRNVIEGDPFRVLEGMTIAAHVVGAATGIVYVRDEYPLAVERLEHAINCASAQGLLGNRILGSALSFSVEIRRGAGAFVCGEETALIASLEGRRGIPRQRPPFPVESGLWGCPTVVNNVETFANVPWILENGAERFARLGFGKSRGTKVFSLAGDVKNVGMIEVPMGITLGEIIEQLGGGSSTGKPIRAVQIGGPSGGCVPAELFHTRVDYESLHAVGAIMGSGGLVALDTSRCMVDVARYFLRFAQAESCGKCTFCRVGTKRMLELLSALCSGGEASIEELEDLARHVQAHSLCGLGRSAPNAVLTTLRYFRSEYEAHRVKKCCPAGRCRDLITFEIDAWLCDGCTLCHDQCVATAIRTSSRAIALAIDETRCTRCGGCLEVCRFSAVRVR